MCKIRRGFVSNSSSSSFIVAFPKGMELTDAAVHNYLYGPDVGTVHAYCDGVSTMDAAQAICEEMKNQIPNDPTRLNEASGGWLEGSPDMDNFKIPSKDGKHTYDYDWDALELARNKFQDEFLKRFINQVGENVDLYTFEFSDNDGNFGRTLEHGDTFDRVPHERISNH